MRSSWILHLRPAYRSCISLGFKEVSSGAKERSRRQRNRPVPRSKILRDGLTELIDEDCLEIGQVVLFVEEQYAFLVLNFIHAPVG